MAGPDPFAPPLARLAPDLPGDEGGACPVCAQPGLRRGCLHAALSITWHDRPPRTLSFARGERVGAQSSDGSVPALRCPSCRTVFLSMP